MSGAGPFSDTRVTIAIVSSHKNQSSVALYERTMGWRVTRIAVKFDDGVSQSIGCDEISGSNCFFRGPLRATLISGLRSSRTFRVRLTILAGNFYDFTFDLTGYLAAERAFVAAQNQYLP